MREFPPAQIETPIERDVYTVARLNKAARQLAESRFAQVWVEGEISNLSAPRSGHLYFTLKDAQAQIRCAYFRSRRALLEYLPEDGVQVLIRARLTVYEARGDLQLVVQHIEPAGEGALREKFERLKRALEREGLFDADGKRPLPGVPRAIGVVTSPTGAAIRDIISTCKRRFAGIPIIVYPTQVQGEPAVGGIIDALHIAVQRQECDVLILARGGGSLEDLWAFNDERVARAVAACTTPVVTGIGHEVDFTIADFVADQRAPTPTAAAELTVPDAAAIARQVRTNATLLRSAISRRIEQLMQRGDLLAHRLIHPTRRYARARHLFELLYGRLVSALNGAVNAGRMRLISHSQGLLLHGPQHRLEQAGWRMRSSQKRLAGMASRLTSPPRQRLNACASRLHAVSPLATLERGYAVVTDDAGVVVTRAEQAAIGSELEVRLARGWLNCRVEGKRD